MALEVISLSLIENKMLEHIKSIGVSDGDGEMLHEFDARSGIEKINRFPAISMATEKIGFRKVDESTLEWSPTVYLYIVFKNVSGQIARRKGAYPIVEGTVMLLSFQDLDLEIEPLEPAGDAEEITHPSLETRGLIGFKVPFKTAYDVSKYRAREEAVKLILSGVKFYTMPGDEIPDYENLIHLQE